MADQKQVTRIWHCPAWPGNPSGLSFGRNGKQPHHLIDDGTEEHVRNSILQFTDKQKLTETKKMVFKGGRSGGQLVSAPNYFQEIYPEDWSKIFIDLDDGEFATLEEAQAQAEKMKAWCLSTFAHNLDIKGKDINKYIAISDSTGEKPGEGFAASLHVCVGRWKIKYGDHLKLLFVNGSEKEGLQERWKVGLPPKNKAPPKTMPYRSNVIDGSIYCKTLMRMLHSAKADSPTRLLKAVTCTQTFYRHIPTIGLGLDGCEVLEQLTPAEEPAEEEAEEDPASTRPSQSRMLHSRSRLTRANVNGRVRRVMRITAAARARSRARQRTAPYSKTHS